MIHSFHYYACYYALLCLLHHHQQQAASLTIIIDGASTREWNTRDEYQRLVDSSQPGGPDEPVASSRKLAEPPEFFGARRTVPFASGAREPPEEEPLEQQQQQQQERQPGDKVGAHQRDRPRLAKTGRPEADAAGARSLSELMALGDQELDGAPIRHLQERGSTPQKYCGNELIDVLDLVCQGRYYSGEFEPQEAPILIKSKRFAAELEPNTKQVDGGGHRQHVGGAQRRRKLHVTDAQTRETGYGLLSRYINNNNEENENDNNNTNNNNNDDINSNINNNNNNDGDINRSNNVINSRAYRNKTLYRRIRGASRDCCARACHLEELRPYCKP